VAGKVCKEAATCNLYALRKSAAEVARHFGINATVQSNALDEIYPGLPSVVVREYDGARIIESMAWGPLRLKGMSPMAKPKTVNNIADLRKPVWVGLARKPQSRCLIPLTAFAEAEGPKGSKTRTWFNVKDQPIFAWAGLWRVSDEWGEVRVPSGIDVGNSNVVHRHHRYQCPSRHSI
jgi:putative SOS response-associated peptidase YedK